MTFNLKKTLRATTAICVASAIVMSNVAYAAGPDSGPASGADAAANLTTATPIKHVIVLVGENRGFDHTFGVYKPKGAGQTIYNILSRGIVNADGTPGPHFLGGQQYSVPAQSSYYIGATVAQKFAYNATNVMPQPNTNGAPVAQSDTGAPFKTVAEASVEADIEKGNVELLTTGATGLPAGSTDTRVPGAGSLTGPYPLQGTQITDDDYTGDTTHRFYQDWQQDDCSTNRANASNNSGCMNDLFPFVMATYAGTSNKSEGNSMGFYNAEQGQAAYLKTLADRFTLSDNFHQSFHGGTAANHVMLGTGDAYYWNDGQGNPTVPPSNQIANPNPVKGTNNQYQVDGNFSECSDATQPGVGPIVSYISNLPYPATPNCQPNHYYMLNNVNPGYLPNGAPSGAGNLPPQTVKTIGDALMEKNIPWAYYAGAYNDAVALSDEAVLANPTSPNLSAAALADPTHALGVAICQICNPFEYATSIMANANVRKAHIQDTTMLISEIKNSNLPAVAIGKPDGLLDGHPSSSKVDLFEAYVQNVLDALEANPKLKAETAVIITWDEAGGYWDGGYIQTIDFFGDGPRIPMLILSPWSTGGKIYHNYGDHASILKFIERNWNLKPLSTRSRDNLPNPTFANGNNYVPTNSPALSDLFDAFDFSKSVDVPYSE